MADLILAGAVLNGSFQHLAIALADEGHRATLLSGTRRTTNAMEVLRQLTRHVVVYNSLDAFDIQTARSEVGGHQVIDGSVAELLQGIQALIGG